MTKHNLIPAKLWEELLPLLPIMRKRKGKAGRNPRNWEDILEAIFYILKTGCQWNQLPKYYPPKSTVYDRFKLLVNCNFFSLLVKEFGESLAESGVINLSECSIDGMFIRAKGGGDKVGNTKCGKGSKLQSICDTSKGLPVSTSLSSASPHEQVLIKETLSQKFIAGQIDNLLADGAYDSDPLDNKLRKQKINLIAPHRKNRVVKKTQDGRQFRRYKRRWTIERFHAWLQAFKRIVIRYEKISKNFLAFVHLAFAIILGRYL